MVSLGVSFFSSLLLQEVAVTSSTQPAAMKRSNVFGILIIFYSLGTNVTIFFSKFQKNMKTVRRIHTYKKCRLEVQIPTVSMTLRPLLLTISIFLCLMTQAQTMYRIGFRTSVQSAVQDAFFVMYDNGTGFARINTASAPRSEIQLMETYASDANGNPDENMLMYQATEGIQLPDSMPAPLYTFWFSKEAATGLYRPFAVTSMASPDRPDVSNIVSDSLIDPNTITPAFVKNYFGVKEDFYLSRFGPRTRGGLSAEEQKTKLFLIIAASTNDESVGSAVALDARNALRVFDTVAQALGIRNNLIVDTIFGDRYSRATVLNSIQKLKPAKQDIVVFYYSGHGFYDTTKPSKKFPFMDLRDPRIRPRADVKGTTLNIESIYESIRAKGARVNLVISDCCNDKEISPPVFMPPPPRPGRPRGDTTLSIENLKALFIPKQPVSMLMTAASPYEKAVANIYTGSYFSNNLFQTLRTRFYPQSEKVSWTGIMDAAKKLTRFQVAAKDCHENGQPVKCHQNPFERVN